MKLLKHNTRNDIIFELKFTWIRLMTFSISRLIKLLLITHKSICLDYISINILKQHTLNCVVENSFADFFYQLDFRSYSAFTFLVSGVLIFSRFRCANNYCNDMIFAASFIIVKAFLSSEDSRNDCSLNWILTLPHSDVFVRIMMGPELTKSAAA